MMWQVWASTETDNYHLVVDADNEKDALNAVLNSFNMDDFPIKLGKIAVIPKHEVWLLAAGDSSSTIGERD